MRQGKVSNQVHSLTSQMKALENNESLTILNMILSQNLRVRRCLGKSLTASALSRWNLTGLHSA